MLGMPAPTPYDLRFQLLGIPVRVHPWFWLVTAILGGIGRAGITAQSVLIWIAVVFVSILVHEFGHGLMARAFGARSEIALYGMGGLCASDREQTPGQRLAVVLAGPGAGFVLFGLTLAWANFRYGLTLPEVLALLELVPGNAATGVLKIVQAGPIGAYVLLDLFQVNLYWGLVNLLPIWPLDGGQASGVLLALHDRRHGPRRNHILALVTAGLLTILVVTQSGRGGPFGNDTIFLALFFGSFAFLNYQALQMYHHRYVEYGLEDDADWWKR